jgi:hypothetical protein
MTPAGIGALVRALRESEALFRIVASDSAAVSPAALLNQAERLRRLLNRTRATTHPKGGKHEHATSRS